MWNNDVSFPSHCRQSGGCGTGVGAFAGVADGDGDGAEMVSVCSWSVDGGVTIDSAAAIVSLVDGWSGGIGGSDVNAGISTSGCGGTDAAWLIAAASVVGAGGFAAGEV